MTPASPPAGMAPGPRTLAAQQAALLEALWAPRPQQALQRLASHAQASPLLERGLRAYRSNGRALAVRALQAAHPAVASLLGDENFEALAHRHWLAHPPQCGDLACWGAELPATIAGWRELADEEPYLADVARVEWRLHRMATLADAVRDFASFALLTQAPLEQASLRLAPGAEALASAWPVVSIVQSQLAGEPTVEAAGALLRAGVAETAVFWRAGWQPRLRQAWSGEAAFIAALAGGASLAQALQAAPELEFDRWLAPAVQEGLLLAAAPFPGASP
jgi:hypothetical protein